jgi:undecaprenyl-diphosphatase
MIFYEVLVGIVLGIVQGFTEFLPISSTAHLLLVSRLTSNGKDLGVSASNFIQFGTLVSILIYYKKELSVILQNLKLNLTSLRQLKRFFQNTNDWLNNKKDFNTTKDYYDVVISQLIIATLPLIFFALLLRKYVESFRDSYLIISGFVLFGTLLIFLGEYFSNRVKTVNFEENNHLEDRKSVVFSLKQVLIVGFFQSLAIFPGVSRSGSTLSGALLTGSKRKDGVYFSFLLSIPAIFLASLYDFIKIIISFFENEINFWPSFTGLVYSTDNKFFYLSLFTLLISTVVSYYVGLICLKWLLKYLSDNPANIFIKYRLFLAFILLITFFILK